MVIRPKFWLLLLPLLVVLACEPARTESKRFSVKGVVQEVYPDGKTVKIKHEAIPDYMPAMTMDFEAHNTNELRGLAKGDAVSFQMVVTDNDGWIEQIVKLNKPPQETPTRRETMRIAREVKPLNVGDVLPDYSFTNELGKAIKLSDYKGNAMAFTFIFTRCPFPTFCPRMANNFLEAQKILQAQANAPTNWHLFSMTFDPEHDSPAVLRDYAKRYQYDPTHWSYLTGDLIDITAITEQFGQQFWTDPEAGGINHNLRTAVIDAGGRVQKVFQGNSWTPKELAEEITSAAQKMK